MEIKIAREQMLKGLFLAHGIADRKNTMQVLANVLLSTTEEGSLLCAATDLKVSVLTEVKAEVIRPGSITVAAKYLYDIVKNLPGDEILLRKEENNYAHIFSGKARFQVVGMSEQDFPQLADTTDVQYSVIDSKTFTSMISKTLFSVCNDDTRRHLSGVLMEWSGDILRMVSTDGHRLSKVEVSMGPGLILDEGIIIPKKGLLEIKKLLEGKEGTCELGLKEGNVIVKADDVILTIKLVDAKFPPYQAVIPSHCEKEVVIDRHILLESLKRVSILSTERNKGIHMELSPAQLRIRSDNPELGEASEDLDVDYEGEELAIGFDARYFMDILNEIDDEKVMLKFSGELDPGLVTPFGNTSYIGVIMPMRI